MRFFGSSGDKDDQCCDHESQHHRRFRNGHQNGDRSCHLRPFRKGTGTRRTDSGLGITGSNGGESDGNRGTDGFPPTGSSSLRRLSRFLRTSHTGERQQRNRTRGDGETIDRGPDDGLFGQDPSVAATYPVSGRTLGGDPTPRHLQAWNRITELVPDRYLNLLTGLEILEGDGDAAAYVYPDDNDPTRWVMGIDVSGMDDAEEFTHTIVHELGHLVTLNSDQVPPVPVNSRYDAVAEACRTYFTGEGCALDGSYMGLFAERFWNDILDEWLALDEITDEDAYWEAADRFWSRHADRFISDYAATNPGEDIAETFAWFVLNDRPAGDTVAEQKVLNMWDQPELVSLREQIRSGL